MKKRAGALLLLPGLLRAALSGPAVTTSDYRVDVGHAVALGSTRHMGMGGADVAVARGSDALARNPAAAAAPLPGAQGNFNWDGTLGSFVVGGRDFDNNGSASTAYRRHVVTQAGGLVQPLRWGFGVLGISQQYDVETAGAVRRFQFGQSFIVAAKRLRGGAWTVGGGIRIAELKVTPKGSSQQLLRLDGSGPVLGVQWAPAGRWRFGGSWMGSVKDDPHRAPAPGAAVMVGGLVAPRGVTIPPSASVGAAYAAPAARPWVLAADLSVTGRVEEAYGVESFLEQRVQRSGRRASFGPRVGGEWEALPGLRLRGGAYREPARFDGVPGRTHGTTGAEVRLFRIPWFGGRALSLGYALDVAPRYVGNFLSVGFWH